MNWTKVRIALEEQSNTFYKEIGEGQLSLEEARAQTTVAEVCRALAIALKFGEDR